MKKTFTKKEFCELTHTIVEDILSKADDLSDQAKFAMMLSCVMAFSDLTHKLFDSEEDEIEIVKEN